MTEQQENELICEKLLGWKLLEWQDSPARDGSIPKLWEVPNQPQNERTPSLTTIAGAGLILEALRMRGTVRIELDVHFADVCFQGIRKCEFELPVAVRALALEYIQVTQPGRDDGVEHTHEAFTDE